MGLLKILEQKSVTHTWIVHAGFSPLGVGSSGTVSSLLRGEGAV
jgi:hypothetical protein